MRHKTLSLTILPVLLAGLFLASCDQAEQGRELHMEKGEYIGPMDSALSDETLNALRQRALRQTGQ